MLKTATDDALFQVFQTNVGANFLFSGIYKHIIISTANVRGFKPNSGIRTFDRVGKGDTG